MRKLLILFKEMQIFESNDRKVKYMILGWGISPGEGIGYPLQYAWAFLVAQLIKNLSVDKGLISKTYKQLIQLNTRKTTQSKNGKTQTHISPKKT